MHGFGVKYCCLRLKNKVFLAVSFGNTKVSVQSQILMNMLIPESCMKIEENLFIMNNHHSSSNIVILEHFTYMVKKGVPNFSHQFSCKIQVI